MNTLAHRTTQFLAICALLVISPSLLHAQFAYVFDNDTITIIGYDGYVEDLIIPDTIEDAPVKTIEENAFQYNGDLKTVTIPKSVSSIGTNAFQYCSSLTTISVDGSNPAYTSAEGVFFNKTRTVIIQYPMSKEGESYDVSNSVTVIGNSAFAGCHLASVNIPNSVAYIGDAAFSFCAALTGVIIPNSVTTIGPTAFVNCTSLTSLTIPEGLTNIAEQAFWGCSGLTNVTIPGSVITIGDHAFAECESLMIAAIPDSVTTIGNSAFYHCDSLTSVTIGGDVSNAGQLSVEHGRALTTAATIGDDAFSQCSALGCVTISRSVAAIGVSAFEQCSGLTNVSILDGVTNIGDAAFMGCYELASVTLGSGVTTIGDWAFVDCFGLTSMAIPDSVTTIGDLAFDSCDGLTNLTLGKVATIGDYAFNGCSGLGSVSIPSSVTAIGDYVFAGCRGLTEIQVAEDNPTCSSRNGVLFNKPQSKLIQYPPARPDDAYTIPNSVTAIVDDAFFQCSSLANLTIPQTVIDIGDYAFNDFFSLAVVSVDEGNPSYSSVDGVLFSKDQKVLIRYPANRPGALYTVPNTVTTIALGAFKPTLQLTQVALPKSVTSIGDSAFQGGQSLTAISTDADNPSYTSVGGVLFDKAQTVLVQYPKLRPANAYAIPNSVTNILSNAFSLCSTLRSVTFPSSVVTIGDAAFQECSNLAAAYFQGNQPFAEVGSFNFSPTVVYYVPGTTGWQSSFGGRPAALWNPQASLQDTALGIMEGQFRFNITNPTDIQVVVEACDNLSTPVWIPVGTNTLTGGASPFSDPKWTNQPTRIYRLRSP